MYQGVYTDINKVGYRTICDSVMACFIVQGMEESS